MDRPRFQDLESLARPIAAGVLLLIAALLSGSAIAGKDRSAPPARTAPAPMPPLSALPKGVHGPDAVMQQAVGVGVRTCYPQLNQILRYLGKDMDMGSQAFFANSSQDSDLLSISMELTGAGDPSFASANIAPVIAASCAFSYDAVTYWPAACDNVGQKAFAGMQSEGVLSKAIRVLSDPKSPLLRVYLMPAGPGCVSIKKEVWF